MKSNIVKATFIKAAKKTPKIDKLKTWFNSSSDELRAFLLKGIQSAIKVLNGLQAKSFVTYTLENQSRAGCMPKFIEGTAAAACRVDTIEHRIMLSGKFFQLRETTRIYGTNEMYESDSQLLTLVHEVTHFSNVFNSRIVNTLMSFMPIGPFPTL